MLTASVTGARETTKRPVGLIETSIVRTGANGRSCDDRTTADGSTGLPTRHPGGGTGRRADWCTKLETGKAARNGNSCRWVPFEINGASRLMPC
jgi:hypothetical protein